MTPEERQAVVTIILAMGKVQDAIAQHLHPKGEMTDRKFIDAVLAAADAQDVVKAMAEVREKAAFLESFERQTR